MPSTSSKTGDAAPKNDAIVPVDQELPPDPLDTLKAWIQAHPAAALMIAAGTGLLVGRLLADVLSPPPPPPTRAQRLKHQARALSSQARSYLHDAEGYLHHAGSAVAHRAGRVASAADDGWRSLSGALGEGQERGAELVSQISEAIQQGVTRGVTRKAAEWASTLSARAQALRS